MLEAKRVRDRLQTPFQEARRRRQERNAAEGDALVGQEHGAALALAAAQFDVGRQERLRDLLVRVAELFEEGALVWKMEKTSEPYERAVDAMVEATDEFADSSAVAVFRDIVGQMRETALTSRHLGERDDDAAEKRLAKERKERVNGMVQMLLEDGCVDTA